MSVKMENVKLRNPILEDETDRLRVNNMVENRVHRWRIGLQRGDREIMECIRG